MYSRYLTLFILSFSTLIHASDIDKKSRMRGMIWGALVADAAALGAHWYYDQADLKERFPDGIYGFEQPAADHYHKTKSSGQFTMYGDALKLLLEVCVSKPGYSPKNYGAAFIQTMTPGNYAGYIDHATRETFEIYQQHLKSEPALPFDFQQGSDDNQMAGATSLMPITLLYLDDPSFYERIADFVRIRQNNPEAIAYCQIQAGILKGLLAGNSAEDAIAQALEEAPLSLMMHEAISARVRDAERELGKEDFILSTFELGYSCPLQGSFPASLFSFMKLKSGTFEDAILSIIRAGGESAGRGMLVGAFLGAYHGETYIPMAWKEKLRDYEAIESLVEQVMQARKRLKKGV